MSLSKPARVQITTFADGGGRTSSHEFAVPLDDNTIAIWTNDAPAWAQRLAGSAVVSVQVADRGGRPLVSEPVLEGRAEVLIEGPDVDRARTLTEAVNGVAAQLSRAADWARELRSEKTPAGAVIVHIVG